MIKWLEPVASRIWCPDEQNEFQYNEEGDGAPLFTEAQLKQAVCDALNEAVGIDWFELMRNNFDKGKSEHIAEVIEAAIRVLIKEIET